MGTRPNPVAASTREAATATSSVECRPEPNSWIGPRTAPPSITHAEPVLSVASEAMKSMRRVTSSTVPLAGNRLRRGHVFTHASRHGRRDWPGMDRHHPDAERPEFERCTLGQASHPPLGGGVGANRCISHQPAVEETVMIAPPLAFFKDATVACMPSHVPVRCCR